MVDPARHRRNIHHKARAVHWGLLPLALVMPGAWIYFALDVCQESVNPLQMAFCRYSVAVPLLPGLLGLACAAWILRDLAHLGAHHANAPKPRIHHVKHGLQSLEAPHRFHVRLAFVEVALVAVGLAVWLAYFVYTTTY